MKLKKILCLALSVALCCICLPVRAAAGFLDVAGLPEQAQILYVLERGLFKGTDEDHFSPHQPLTRAQAVAVLARQAQVSGTAETVFSDVPEGAYYQAAVGWASQNGLIQGVTQTAFEPERPITHEELAELLQRYYGWLGRTDQTALPAGTDAVTRAQGAAIFAELDQMLLARDTTLRSHTAKDGVTLTGKLDLPQGQAPVEKLVLFVNGSGPNTYDNRRQSGDLNFNYFDVFAQQFGMRGIGFFRWNTRGVSVSDTPPMYDAVDEALYRTYLPETSVSDIGEWIETLRQEPRLKDAEIWLLGWSEGTIIAPLAAQQFPDEIAGLLLAGYCNDRLDETFDWQQSGASSMIFYKQYFDLDGDGAISQQEYAADPYGIVAGVLENAAFSDIDVDGDGKLTQADFAIMLAPGKAAFYDAVERGDDQWLASNYGVRLTSGWFQAHQKLAPNRQTMLTLDLPMYIFHGTYDANCDVAGARAIEESFASHGKDNLTVRIYEGYDHDLLYTVYAYYGVMPQAFEDLFQTVTQAE